MEGKAGVYGWGLLVKVKTFVNQIGRLSCASLARIDTTMDGWLRMAVILDQPKSNFFALILIFAILLQQCGKINLNLITPTVALEGFNIFMKTGKDWVFFKHHPPEDYFLFGPLEFFVGQIWNKLHFFTSQTPWQWGQTDRLQSRPLISFNCYHYLGESPSMQFSAKVGIMSQPAGP